nr:aminotransferase class V-fold PLP-dependent enzyme [Lachnospiraceae bacterium]
VKIDGCTVNGKTDRTSAPHIVSVSVDGVRSEVLLHSLEDKKVFVSAGSACSSNKPAVSRTLKAINVKRELLDSTVRFSFSVHTTEEEIKYALSVMNEIVPMLRKYRRK